MTLLLQLANQQLTENNVWQQCISLFLALMFVIISWLLGSTTLHVAKIYYNQSWKATEKLKVLSEKRNDFWKRKAESKSEKKIEKPKAKSKNFVYITFLSPFPPFHNHIAWTIENFISRLIA